MSTRCDLLYSRFCLCLLVVAVLSGCASRKIVTAVEDQSYVPGPTAQAQVPVAEGQPIPPPKVEEARVAEQLIVSAPQSQQPVAQARPTPVLSVIFFDYDRF